MSWKDKDVRWCKDILIFLMPMCCSLTAFADSQILLRVDSVRGNIPILAQTDELVSWIDKLRNQPPIEKVLVHNSAIITKNYNRHLISRVFNVSAPTAPGLTCNCASVVLGA
jgi:hypothetical protein